MSVGHRVEQRQQHREIATTGRAGHEAGEVDQAIARESGSGSADEVSVAPTLREMQRIPLDIDDGASDRLVGLHRGTLHQR